MNNRLKWLQGWTAQSGTQHQSDMHVITLRLFAQKDSKELQNSGLKDTNLHLCVITLIIWVQNVTHSSIKFRFYCKFLRFLLPLLTIFITSDGPMMCYVACFLSRAFVPSAPLLLALLRHVSLPLP